MARIRTVKPDFWIDEKTGQLSSDAKCLFIGLLNLADDYGVVEYSPVEWRAKIFPYASHTTPGVVEQWLVEEILPSGIAILFSYANDNNVVRRYLFLTNFDKHQVINKPSKPLLSGWEKGDSPKRYADKAGVTYEELGSLETGQLSEPSGSPPTPLRPGKERKGREGSIPVSNETGTLGASAEDAFWGFAPELAAKSKTTEKSMRSVMGRLKAFHDGDCDAAMRVLAASARKDHPLSYITTVINKKREENAKPKHDGGFVPMHPGAGG